MRRFISQNPGQVCSATEFAALAYLVLPLFIFCASFLRPLLAIPAVSTIVIVLCRVCPRRLEKEHLDYRSLIFCAALAAVYLAFCGYLPSTGRSWDWIKHFAIINELGEQPWPPIRSDTQTFLRYYLGYYLIPGLFSKLFGNRLIEIVVFFQTWLGLFLVLGLFLQKLRPKHPAAFIVLFLLFSGLDLVGWLLLHHDGSVFLHKEWWAGAALFSYQGHATLFLWVPQHGLAGLLGVAILLPDGERQTSPHIIGLLGAAVLFWSPFVALGLLPFGLAIAIRSGREAFLDWGNLLCGLVLGVPLSAYLLAGAGTIPHGTNISNDSKSIAIYGLFLLLEVGVYLIALWLCCWRNLHFPLLVIAVLALLPLYRIGLYNDLAMRASIPALALIAIAASSGVSETKGIRRIPLALLMLIGSAASILEIIGRGQDGHVLAREVSMKGFLTDDPDYFVQYNAPMPHWVLRQ